MVEVGWSITPARWGEGLAPEAARAALDWGFDRCALDEVVSFTMRENLASQRVMQKLGMGFVRDFERSGFPHVLYATRRRSIALRPCSRRATPHPTSPSPTSTARR